ncbi:translocase subunit SecA [Acrasis kona]|uniref:Translocase subunit SecA n=1 Tax=Acrasis kona TaxID=1008807 RepID=A0AAW2ZPX9_9EUKA
MPSPSFWGLITGTAAVTGYWRDIGGSAIVFTAIKNFVFGKTLKTVEYPSGNMKTISVRFASVHSIKKRIAVVNDLGDHGVIKQLYKWEDNYWTEELVTSNDVRNMNDFAWVLWTRSTGRLPPKGVNLKEMNAEAELLLAASRDGNVLEEVPPAANDKDHTLVRTASGKLVDRHVLEQAQLHSKNAVKVKAIKLVTLCRNPSYMELGDNAFTEVEANYTIDLILNDDSYMISLYSNFKEDPVTFAKYCKKKANSRNDGKTTDTNNSDGSGKGSASSEDDKRKDGGVQVNQEETQQSKREEGVRNLFAQYDSEVRDAKGPEPPNNKPPVTSTSTSTTKSGAVATF